MISQLYSHLVEHVDGAPKVDSIYRPLLTIGEGRFAKVKICYHMEEKTFYAMKVLKKGFSLQDLRAFVTEVELLSKLSSLVPLVPRIVDANFRGEYHRPGSQPTRVCYYVMDLAENGELFSLMRYGQPLPEDCVRFLFRRMLSVLEALHQKQVYHRDLKLENFLVDRDLRLILCDFGCSVEIQSDKTPSRRLGGIPSRDIFGTLAFNAPEVHIGEGSRFDMADVFSLGCALFLLVGLNN